MGRIWRRRKKKNEQQYVGVYHKVNVETEHTNTLLDSGRLTSFAAIIRRQNNRRTLPTVFFNIRRPDFIKYIKIVWPAAIHPF